MFSTRTVFDPTLFDPNPPLADPVQTVAAVAAQYAAGRLLVIGHPEARPVQELCRAGRERGLQVALNTADPQRYDLVICLGLSAGPTDATAQRLVTELCARGDDILFAPMDLMAPVEGFAGAALGRWAALFAEHGFFYDPNEWRGASYYPHTRHPPPVTRLPPAPRFRRSQATPIQAVAVYSALLWRLTREREARQALACEQGAQVARLTAATVEHERRFRQLRRLEQQLDELSGQWHALHNSPGGAVLRGLQRLRQTLAPPASRRERGLEMVLGWLRIVQQRGLSGLAHHFQGEILWRFRALTRSVGAHRYRNTSIDVPPVRPRPTLRVHRATVDIVVCVHNALEDVQRCLASVLAHTGAPYALVLVDDGSAPPTRDYLAEFARRQRATLLRSDTATGYTRAANRGLRHSHSDYVVLLNSDTVVTPGWLDRLVACAESDERIGLVGPLSNTASWQSIPEVSVGDDWADNPLPPGVDVDEWARRLAHRSARHYPAMPFLNGFCLLVRRTVVEQIGYFDEEHFGDGYGEENDYALRARAAGWTLALADDAYVHHAQSRSYSHERRRQLSARAAQALQRKHGQATIDQGMDDCLHNRVLTGIRARARVMAERDRFIEQGRRRFGGRRLLFLLPSDAPGGGANVVITEAQAMQRMGVDVHIFNLAAYRHLFGQAYPGLAVPVHYGEAGDVAAMAGDYDAVVATWHESVYWMADIRPHGSGPVRGYYVQDYEPYFYPDGSEEYRRARATYTLFPDLIRLTKTEWNRREVAQQVNVECAVVGASVDIDRLQPRPRRGVEDSPPRREERKESRGRVAGALITRHSPLATRALLRPRRLGGKNWVETDAGRLRVVAMVRPNSPRRAPLLTMQTLRRLSRRFGSRVEITLFGTRMEDPGFAALPQDFDWQLAGMLTQDQVAHLLNLADIFVDLSTYQAMGLTALEAMACGAAAIVPRRGGAGSFAVDGHNALVVDTGSPTACWDALVRLVEDDGLRRRLQQRAIEDACAFFPERAAFNILDALLGCGGGRNP